MHDQLDVPEKETTKKYTHKAVAQATNHTRDDENRKHRNSRTTFTEQSSEPQEHTRTHTQAHETRPENGRHLKTRQRAAHALPRGKADTTHRC